MIGSRAYSSNLSRRQFVGKASRALFGAWGALHLAQPSLLSAAEAKTIRPNVVLIIADDLAWSDLACYGNQFHETPNLDQLAREGMKFTDAYAASPVCSPTRASLLTGKYPARIGMTHITQYQPQENTRWKEPFNQPFLPLDEITISEALKSAGYATAHIGKWHLGLLTESDPVKQGSDINIAGSDLGQPPDYFYPYTRTIKDGRTYQMTNPPKGREGDYLDERLTDEAEKFIEQHRARPFFLFMSHYLPHTSIGDRLQARAEKIAKYQKKAGLSEPNEKIIYAAMIEHLDDCVGRLTQKLDALGIADNTLVIFASDNGGNGGKTSNAPLRGAKSDGYEGGIRVPTIVRWKGHFRAGSTSAVPIITTDLCPTILEAASTRSPAGKVIDGVSLLPLFTRNQAIQRDAIFWHYPHFSPRAFSAVRAGRWKLIEFLDDQGAQYELYDLVEDPAEKNDLASKLANRMHELQSRLDQWRKSVGARMPTQHQKDP